MSSMKFLGLALLVLTSLAACSSVKEDLRPAKLEKITATHKIKHEWSNFVGVGQDARYSKLQPIIVDGFVYTVDVKGHLKQLSLDKGVIHWTLDLGTSIGGGIGYGGGLLYLGAINGQVIAVDPTTGAEKWRAQSSSEITSAPQSNDDVVVAVSIDGRVFAYDIKDGVKRWNYDHPVPVLSLRSTASPYVKGENVFIGFDNGQLLSFNASSGQLIWSARVGQPQGKTELDRLVDIDADPIEYGPYIYGAGYNSKIIAVTRGSGTVMWSQDLSTTLNIVAVDGAIITVDVDSHIKAFDALNGAILWDAKHLHRRGVSSAAVLNGVVVVIDSDGIIHGLSLKTGEPVTRLRTHHDSVFAQPIVNNGLLYILDVNGELSAYSVAESATSSKQKTIDSHSVSDIQNTEDK